MAEREELILDVRTQLDDAQSQVAALQAELDKLEEPVTVTSIVEGQEEIDALTESTAALDATEATVELNAEDNATDIIEDAGDALHDLDGSEAEVEVAADDEATDTIEDVRDAVEDLDGTTAEVQVKTDDAVSSLDALRSSIADLASGKDGLPALTKAVGDLMTGKSGLATLGSAAGLGALVGFLGQATTGAYDFTQQVEELSLFTGQATEESSRLLAVMQDFTGIQLGELEGMIARVGDKFAENAELAAQLGINIDSARGPLDLFVQAIDALNSGQLSAQERISLGMDIFGRRGIKAVNDIASSIDGPLADALNEVADSRILTDEDLETANNIEQSIGELKGRFAEISLEVGGRLLPLLEKAADLMQLISGPVTTPQDELANTLMLLNEFSDAEREAALADQEFKDQINEGLGPLADIIRAAQAGFQDLPAGIDATTLALEALGTASTFAVEESDRMTFTTNELNEALRQMNISADASQFRNQWQQIKDDLADGGLLIDRTTTSVNYLAEALGKTPEEILAIAQADLEAELKADEAAARSLGDTIGDVVGQFQDAAAAIADIRLTRFDSLGDDLQDALDMGDVEVDFQSLKVDLRDAFVDLQDFIDEEGAPDWSALLRTDVDVAGFNSEIAGLITQVRDQFQAGIVEAFELGGAPAAQHFVDSFLPQLTALGMTPAQAYELLGLPADGSVQAIIDVQVDIAARDRAKQILDAIAGVDPGNPLIAALKIQLLDDDIDPELIEIAALVAAQEMGIPVSLEGIPPEDLTAAQAILDNAGLVTPIAVDMAKAEKDLGNFRDAQKAELLPVTAKAETDDADRDMEALRSKRRVADVEAKALTTAAGAALDGLKSDKAKGGPRVAPINAIAHVAVANLLLNLAARPRTAVVNMVTGSIDVPSANDIARMIGTVRVPIDAYIRNVPRIDGSRYVV